MPVVPLVGRAAIRVRGGDKDDYARVVEQFRRRNPDAIIGTYVSGGGCRPRAQFDSYPPETIAYDRLPKSAYTGEVIDGAHTVNVADERTADQFADLIIQEAIDRRMAFLYLDEIRHPSSGGTKIPWEAMTRYLRRIRTGLNAHGMKLVANVAVSPWIMAGRDADLLAEAVDGMCFEGPFEPQWCRPNAGRVAAEIDVYRKWLAAGKLILLAPTGEREHSREDEYRLIAAMAVLIREPGQSLFVHQDYFRSEPDWGRWPAQYGAPRGKLDRSGPLLWRREFESGRLMIDPAKGQAGPYEEQPRHAPP